MAAVPDHYSVTFGTAVVEETGDGYWKFQLLNLGPFVCRRNAEVAFDL
jgi:hypothetical protein